MTGVQTCALPIWMQGARLTAWEMVEEKIPVTLLCEGAAASLLASGKLAWVIVGSDRIAANGDVGSEERRVGKECRSRWGVCLCERI